MDEEVVSELVHDMLFEEIGDALGEAKRILLYYVLPPLLGTAVFVWVYKSLRR